MAWLSLFIAALFEIAWTFSLKYIDMKRIAAIDWRQFFKTTEGMRLLLPLLGYIIFGLANIYFFSVALKTISTATALAVWMGISLIGVKIVEITILKQPYSYQEFLFMLFVLIGIIGLKSIK